MSRVGIEIDRSDIAAARHGDTIAISKIVTSLSPPLLRYVRSIVGDEYVKRIVALSGDRVEIKDGPLMINDKSVGDRKESVEDYGPVTVPEYNCFVMGDNVANSKDSRHFGPIPYATVYGRVTVKDWPPGGGFE